MFIPCKFPVTVYVRCTVCKLSYGWMYVCAHVHEAARGKGQLFLVTLNLFTP